MPSSCSKLKESISALDFEFDVIALSETWLKDNDHDHYNMEGYSMFTCSRVDKMGGGVAMYINNSLQHRYLQDKSKCIKNCADIVSVEITLSNSNKVIICCVYRAPNTDLSMLSEFLTNILRNVRKNTVIMCGDFNADYSLTNIVLLMNLLTK